MYLAFQKMSYVQCICKKKASFNGLGFFFCLSPPTLPDYVDDHNKRACAFIRTEISGYIAMSRLTWAGYWSLY